MIDMAFLAFLFVSLVITFVEIADRCEKSRKVRLARLSLSPVLLPMIRRFMPKIIAMELVGVQSMTAPSGEVFTLRSSYLEPYQMAFPFPYPEPVIERVPVQMDMFPDQDD